MARMISKQTWKATVAYMYVEYKYSCTVGLHTSVVMLHNFRFTTLAYIIMTMRVFIRDIAGGDSSRYCKVYYIWRPPPARPSL